MPGQPAPSDLRDARRIQALEDGLDPADDSGPLPAEMFTPQMPRWIWPVYLALFAASVPWYLPADGGLRLWFGLPHWVVLSLAACLAVALFTVFVIARYWRTPAAPRRRRGGTPR